MDAAKASDDPGATSSLATDFKEMNLLTLDDFSGVSKPIHGLVDAIQECMTAQLGNVKRRYEAVVDTYEGRLVKWAAEKKALEDEKAALNAKLLEAKTGEDELTAKMKEKDEKISKYESCVAELQDVDTKEFSDNMQGLWEKFKEFATKFFLSNISSDLFDSSQWDLFIDQLGLKGTIPLPTRNTEPAKKARVAAALATIASMLSTRIFTPFYFYRPTASDDFKELLIRLAEEDSRKELMCRALLLSPWTKKEQRDAEECLVKEATGAVAKSLGFWINDNTLDAFRRELLGLFKEAVELWRQTQNSSVKFEATVDDIDEPGWEVLSALSNGEPPEDSQAKPATVALFPRVLVIGKDEDVTLFDGIGLWDWQTAAAEQELKEDMEAKGRPRRGRRKMSNATNGALMSPIKLKGASFLGRGKTDTDDGTG
ncbi:hypothetical protein CLAIMM_13706 [Cladophialophora immunda]|nr:hypothetical protein CLAIMM_13706 [Cladophialophora immunda]